MKRLLCVAVVLVLVAGVVLAGGQQEAESTKEAAKAG